MDAIRAWAQSVVLVSLLLAMMEMILPENRVREAVRTVGGLILLLTMIGPVLRWVGSPGIAPTTANRLAETLWTPSAADRRDGWLQEAQRIQAAGWSSAQAWQQEYLAQQAAAWVSRWSGRPATASWQEGAALLSPERSSGSTLSRATAQLVVTVPSSPEQMRDEQQAADWGHQLAALLNLLPDQVTVTMKEVSS